MSRHVWIPVVAAMALLGLKYAPVSGQSNEKQEAVAAPLVAVDQSCEYRRGHDGGAEHDVRVLEVLKQKQGIRIQFHVFDPSYTLVSDRRLVDQLTRIRSDYAVYGIEVVQVPTVLYYETAYDVINSAAEEAAMKSTYAVDPENQLNIYIVGRIDMDGDGSDDYRGAAVCPLNSKAQTVQGGIVIDGSYIGISETLLTHEIGHCLGLWHTPYRTPAEYTK